MAKERRRAVLELLQRPGNAHCADCGAPDPDWASYTLGVFICLSCSGIHRNIPQVSKVKSVRLDTWEEPQVEFMASRGNSAARAVFESRVPPFYYRPSASDCQLLREQWIRAKYERQEFTHPERQEPYSAGYREGFLWKRGRDNGQFLSRKFVLTEREGALKYFNRSDAKEPKAVMKIEHLNATFQPAKIGHPHGLQVTYLKDNSTRNIFVYHEDGKEMVDWFNALRAARFHYLQVAFPGASDADLVPKLSRNYLQEGYMEKTGPKVRPLRSPGRPGPSARLCLGHQGLCGTRGAQSGSDTPSEGLRVPPFCSSAGTPARDPGALGAWKQNPEDTSCPEARASSKPRLLPQRRAPWGPCHVGGGVRGPRPCLGRPSAPSPTADGRLPEALVHHGRPQAHVLQRPPGKDGRARAPGWTEGLPAGRGGGRGRPGAAAQPGRPQDAFARGEVFIGSRESGYTVLDGLPPSTQGHHWPHGITIVTPERRFLLACETEPEQRAWMEAFRKVVDRPMLPQEYAGEAARRPRPGPRAAAGP
uniref:ArfGAP with dual PH domains 1 n=1 Tax=Sus scrofa TaxID=9823 RepID=A0A8D0XM48_PIG